MIRLTIFISIIIGFIGCGSGGSSGSLTDNNSSDKNDTTVATVKPPTKPSVAKDLTPPLPPEV